MPHYLQMCQHDLLSFTKLAGKKGGKGVLEIDAVNRDISVQYGFPLLIKTFLLQRFEHHAGF